MLNKFIQRPSARVLGFTFAISLYLISPSVINSASWAQTRSNVNPLVEQLQSSNEQQWRQAIEALSKRGTEAVPALRNVLKSSNARVRSGAAFALRRIGAVASVAVPDLALLLKDSNQLVLCERSFCFSKYG